VPVSSRRRTRRFVPEVSPNTAPFVLSFCFFSVSWIVVQLTAGAISSSTTFSASKRNVQPLRPSGGSDSRSAMTFASCSPSRHLARGGAERFFSVERDVETFGDQFRPNVFDALPRTEKSVGDVLVFPVRPVGVGLEQDVGTPDFRIRSLQFFDDGETRFPLFVGQANNVNFFHGKTSLLVKTAIIAGFEFL